MRTKAHGFTLIELLVVVAIIALLISILLPSLGRAREQSKFVICAGNLKQIGLAYYYYGQDNREQPPPNRLRPYPGGPLNGTPPDYRDMDWWYYAHMVPKYMPGNLNSGTSAAFSGVFRCPSDQVAGRAYSMNVWAGNYDPNNKSHQGMAMTPMVRGSVFNPYRVAKASSYLLMGESHAIYRDAASGLLGANFIIGWDGEKPYVKFCSVPTTLNAGEARGYINWLRHRERANFLLADLHVSAFSRLDIVRPDTVQPTKWVSTLKVQWSPDDLRWNTPALP